MRMFDIPDFENEEEATSQAVLGGNAGDEDVLGGRGDYFFQDFDGDGRADKFIDSDGDGYYERIALDRDGDGIYEELQLDTDNDGYVDSIYFDSNGDNIYEERWYDSNDDGYYEQKGLDTNLDVHLDLYHIDTDGDGKMDYTVEDFDKDGHYETLLQDIQPDAVFSQMFLDSDGDNYYESIAMDTDGDGKFDSIITDTDGDGYTDMLTQDTDGDSVMDQAWKDLDGDGQYDRRVDVTVTGAGEYGLDSDGDGYLEDFFRMEDIDGDGFLESRVEYSEAGEAHYADYDRDGRVDSVFRDLDGDGTLDTFFRDMDGDGYFEKMVQYGENMDRTEYTDTDGDGVLDKMEQYDGNDSLQLDPAQAGARLEHDLINGTGIDVVAIDQDGDGIYETLMGDADGDGILDTRAVDLDGDGRAETLLMDKNHDGIDEVALRDLDGDGVIDVMYRDFNGDGEFEYQSVDTDGDGTLNLHITDRDNPWIPGDYDKDEYIQVTPLEDFDYDAHYANHDGRGTSYDDLDHFNPRESHGDGLFGDPGQAMKEWEFQGNTMRCALYSQMFVIEEFTDHEVDMDQIAREFASRGWFIEDVGTPLQYTDKLLEYYDIKHEVDYNGSMEQIQECLEEGGRVIVALDAEELWYRENDDVYLPGDGANHAVEVIGIDLNDEGDPVVILNDSGDPRGQGIEIPLSVFMDAWEDSNNYMIECYDD